MASRWDITLQFLSGPLSTHPPSLTLGPEIRLGRRLRGHGIQLSAEYGIEDEHAVITVDPAGNASIAPVGEAPVRVATDRLADWRNHPPLRGPVVLVPGDVVHLGPIYRGVSFCFVRARPIESAPHADTSRTPAARRWRRPVGVAILVLALILLGARGLGFFTNSQEPASLVTADERHCIRTDQSSNISGTSPVPDGADCLRPLPQTASKSDDSD